MDETQNREDGQVDAIPNTNFKLSCFFLSHIYALYCCNIKINFHQDYEPVICRGGVFEMVEQFLWETNGTVPFKGQCFLLSDFLQWARNINGSEV